MALHGSEGDEPAVKPVVFIHTNDKQMVGARLSAYSLRTRSAHADAFDVRVLRLEETPHLYKREGQSYLRKGRTAVWRNDDLQSFSPLRMMVPQVMGFEGRALVIDPDVFAVGDVYELLSRDMQGKAVLCRHVEDGYRGNGVRFFASSVMLLDCVKLRHWQWDQQIDDMFSMKMDYGPWISLLGEPEGTVGGLEEEWNHFDVLDDTTRLLHNTERSTQPWKTGLPVDYDLNRSPPKRAAPDALWRRVIHALTGRPGRGGEAVARYQRHPDRNQERFFFDLLHRALDDGAITRRFIEQEVRNGHVRPDVLRWRDTVESADAPLRTGRAL